MGSLLKVDKMEADNALHQAQKEIEQRYDFKGVGASVDWSGEKLLMKASSEERVRAVWAAIDRLDETVDEYRSAVPCGKSK
jgi:uncharacterized protein YajQ (UPF0234 family)